MAKTAAKLFAGLKFYFYPPKAISKLNGVKANACARFGATIHSRPNKQTTHVMVSPDAISPALASTLSAGRISAACVVVDHNWPSDCIEQSQLLDTSSYVVPVAPPSTASDGSSSASVVAAGLKRPHEGPEDRSAKAPKHADSDGSLSPQTRFEQSLQTQSGSESEAGPVAAATSASASASGSDSEAGSKSGAGAPARSASFNAGDPAAGSSAGNEELIQAFHDLMLSREAAGEEFSARAYQRAIQKLVAVRKRIVTAEDALKTAGLSKNMAALVADIRRGNLAVIISPVARQRAEIVNLLSSVFGVGPYKAAKFYEQGCRTLDDLKDKVDDNGRVSIAHHQDFAERMSRTEVDKHYARVKALVAETDAAVQAFCMGSYRRGQPDCGDIDIILTRPGAGQKELARLLEALLKRMFACGLAKHTFTQGRDRWLGATDVLAKWRRMDILLVPWSELGAAMIYYTGNDVFNRRLRLRAKQRGMRLSGNALYKIAPDGAKSVLESHDERRIFELLKVPWLEPHERIFK